MPVFRFTLYNFTVDNTRSRHEDTDYVAIGLKVGSRQFSTQTKKMGNLNNGTYDVQLSFNDIMVSENGTPVLFNYQIINNGHASEADLDNALTTGAKQLAGIGATAAGDAVLPGSGSIWGQVASAVVGWLGGNLFADCDGPVAVDQISVNGATLIAWTQHEEHQEKRQYPGIDSAGGCGGNSDYKVLWGVARLPKQDGWRWCNKCNGLHFGVENLGHCPAGGQHSIMGSGDYAISVNDRQARGQNGWCWCKRCNGLFFSGRGLGKCPAPGGGTHSKDGSGDYTLGSSGGQSGWMWCSKCEGLHYIGHLAAGETEGPKAGACPAGGNHTAVNSGNYSILNQ